jgi:hypothetical protein
MFGCVISHGLQEIKKKIQDGKFFQASIEKYKLAVHIRKSI